MHGRVRPCAKAEVVSNKLFPKSNTVKHIQKDLAFCQNIPFIGNNLTQGLSITKIYDIL